MTPDLEHGTGVAGIIGANDNEIGIRGIADTAQIVGAPSGTANDTETLAEAFATDMELVRAGARVINNSLGIEVKTELEFATDGSYLNPLYTAKYYLFDRWSGAYDAYLASRRAEAEDYAAYAAAIIAQLLVDGQDEFLVVQSAGNHGLDSRYNGGFGGIDEEVYQRFYNQMSDDVRAELDGHQITYDAIRGHILSVGAVDNKRTENGYRMSSFSNYGELVDICAPGRKIYTTAPDSKYVTRSGTSLAAPMVTGAAAMVWSLQPELSAAQVKEILIRTAGAAYGVGDDKGSTYRMLNVGAAVQTLVGDAVTDETATTPSEIHAGSALHISADDTAGNVRDIVLALDASGSMDGTPMEETQRAATSFVDTAIGEGAGVGLVIYSDALDSVTEITTDRDLLVQDIYGAIAGNNTNIENALQKAREMLEDSGADKRIIVLMSDGLPNEGLYGYDLVDYAEEIKEEGIYLYTLGFFQNADSDEKASGQTLLELMASEGCHYEVDDAGALQYFFGDIADQINGQRYIYIRIACPVDVRVDYNGEVLDSSEEGRNTRTDYGVLSLEESDSVYDTGSVKVLRLKEGADYEIEITGTGTGSMDYTIGFMDDAGGYSDLRTFENIHITPETVIDTTAAVSHETVLNVDQDGDGECDLRYRATANGKAESVMTDRQIRMIAMVVVATLAILIALLLYGRYYAGLLVVILSAMIMLLLMYMGIVEIPVISEEVREVAAWVILGQ